MRERLKHFFLRAVLLITKSFVYLGRTISKNIPNGARRALRSFGRRLRYGLLWILSPIYQVYRRLKRFIIDFWKHPSPWLRPLSHRYALHALIVLIAGVAV